MSSCRQSWLSEHAADHTLDEGNQADLDQGGGHLATVIVSPKAKEGFQSTNAYQHQSTLRLILAGLRSQ